MRGSEERKPFVLFSCENDETKEDRKVYVTEKPGGTFYTKGQTTSTRVTTTRVTIKEFVVH